MDAKMTIEREIDRMSKFIEDCENTIAQVPEHLRPTQEFALEIYKKKLDTLKQELTKLEAQNFENRMI